MDWSHLHFTGARVLWSRKILTTLKGGPRESPIESCWGPSMDRVVTHECPYSSWHKGIYLTVFRDIQAPASAAPAVPIPRSPSFRCCLENRFPKLADLFGHYKEDGNKEGRTREAILVSTGAERRTQGTVYGRQMLHRCVTLLAQTRLWVY